MGCRFGDEQRGICRPFFQVSEEVVREWYVHVLPQKRKKKWPYSSSNDECFRVLCVCATSMDHHNDCPPHKRKYRRANLLIRNQSIGSAGCGATAGFLYTSPLRYLPSCKSINLESFTKRVLHKLQTRLRLTAAAPLQQARCSMVAAAVTVQKYSSDLHNTRAQWMVVARFR